MSETAQIILASGFAVFLALLAMVAVIWVVRCRPDSPTFRNPLMLLAGPFAVGVAIIIKRLIG